MRNITTTGFNIACMQCGDGCLDNHPNASIALLTEVKRGFLALREPNDQDASDCSVTRSRVSLISLCSGHTLYILVVLLGFHIEARSQIWVDGEGAKNALSACSQL